MFMSYTNHLIYKLSNQTYQQRARVCVYVVRTSFRACMRCTTLLHTTSICKLLFASQMFSRRVWWAGGFQLIFKKMIYVWFFASSMSCAYKKSMGTFVSGRLLIYYPHRVGGIITVATEGNIDKWMAVPLLKVWFCCHLHEMAHQIEFEDHPGVFQAEISSKTARASFKSNM